MLSKFPGEVMLEVDKDHFITRNGVTFAGNHIILDIWNAKYLNDREFIENTLIDAIEQAGATLLHIHLHTFTEGGGISGVAVLAESHISVHTWPEKSFAAFDIFMCGVANPEKAVDAIKKAFKPERVIVGGMKRGVMSGSVV